MLTRTETFLDQNIYLTSLVVAVAAVSSVCTSAVMSSSPVAEDKSTLDLRTPSRTARASVAAPTWPCIFPVSRRIHAARSGETRSSVTLMRFFILTLFLPLGLHWASAAGSIDGREGGITTNLLHAKASPLLLRH